MNLLKQIFFLTVFCSILPIHAMDGDHGAGFFANISRSAQENPVQAVHVGIIAVGGSALLSYGIWKYPDHRFVTQVRAAEGARLNALLKSNIKSIDATDLNSVNALQWAAYDGQTEKVAVLLAHGAHIEEKCFFEKLKGGHWTALNLAAALRHTKTVKLLVARGADVSTQMELGLTPLLFSAVQRDVDSVLCLIQRASFSSKKNLSGAAFIPKDATTDDICRLLVDGRVDVAGMIAQYPMTWFKELYTNAPKEVKGQLLATLIPAIAEYRMAKVKELLADPKLRELDSAKTTDEILVLLDESRAEQHREAIAFNIRNEFAPHYYSVLNVNQCATQNEIKTAYKKLALRYHPDKIKDSGLTYEQAEAKFKELQEAYETLSDSEKRREYDLGIV